MTYDQFHAVVFNMYGVKTPVQMQVMLYAFRARTTVLCRSREDGVSGTMTSSRTVSTFPLPEPKRSTYMSEAQLSSRK